MAVTGMKLTTKGVILHGKAQTGTPLVFTKIQIGSGQLTPDQDITTLTALIDPKMDLTIQPLTIIGDGTVRARCLAVNTGVTEGFFLREAGIFATDPDDGEILYAISNMGEEAGYFPPGGGAVAVEHQLDLIIIIGNAPNVSISVINDSQLNDLIENFQQHRTLNPIDHPDGSVVDAAIGTRIIDDSVQATGGAGTLTSLLSKIGNMIKAITGKTYWYTPPATTLEAASAHAQDTDNPHGTTAAQTYALALAGGNMGGAINENQGNDIASASTCNIGAATGNFVRITGTSTITRFGTVQAGTRRIVRFAGALTLTHHSTYLILPTGANITTAAGDTAEFISLGYNSWVCVMYQRASGLAIVAPYLPLAGGTMTGAIAMGSNKITGLANGTASGDAVNYGQFEQSLVANGYKKLPGGFILQWGAGGQAGTGARTITVTLPIAFPNTCLRSFAIDAGTGCYTLGCNPTSASTISIYVPAAALGVSTTPAGTSGVSYQYWAIGN